MLCFFILAPVLVFAADGYYQLPSCPGGRIFTQDRGMTPTWLQSWTAARNLVENSRLEEAVARYETLVALKGNLVQPRWELARLLIQLERYDQAAVHLESLLKIVPDDPRYLNAMGYVMEQNDHERRALELFQKVYGLDRENVQALKGICHILLKTGRGLEREPFLEKLSLLVPDNNVVRRQLAEVYYDLGKFEKARRPAASLTAQPDATVEDQRLAARIYDRLGLMNISVRYWRKVLGVCPDDLEARRLSAAFCLKEKSFDEALEHLLVLRRLGPESDELLLRLGRVYHALGQYTQAMRCMTEVVDHDPDNKEALRISVDIQAALGNEEETLAGIERYLAVEENPSSASLRHAAGLYDAVGRHAEAIELYRRILRFEPGDEEVLGPLARDLQAVGDDVGALVLWKKMQQANPESSAVYLGMILSLERLGRDEELVAVLEELRSLGGAGPEISLKLALLYLKTGRYEQGRELFGGFSPLDSASPEFFFLRGKIFEELSAPAQALGSYEKALALSPADRESRLGCLRLAGVLGLREKVNDNILALKEAGLLMDWRVRLVAADARRDCGDDRQALAAYRTILDEEGRWDCGCALETLVALAGLYARQDRFFEAEQSLRQALLLRHDQAVVYVKLIGLALAAHDPDKGRQWLAGLRSLVAGQRLEKTVENNIDLLEVRLLNAAGKYRDALKAGQALLPEFTPAERSGRRQLLVELFHAELLLGNSEPAMGYCRKLLDRYPDEPVSLVLLEKAQRRDRDGEGAGRTADRALVAGAGGDEGLLLELAELYGEYGLYDSMLRAANLARRKMPKSLRAVVLLGRALAKTGGQAEAVALYTAGLADFPGNSRLREELAGLFCLTGADELGVKLCDELLADEPQRADIILLKARMLWAGQRWHESLELYRRYLSRDVEDIFIKKSRGQELGLEFPQQEKGFLRFMGLGETSGPDNLARIMDVFFVADRERDRVNRLAVPLYAQYRWRNYFSLELAARKSVRRREYFQAVKEFERLRRENPAETALLFDLAGIYSRLGRLGDEALIYEEISKENLAYPGLAEAMERNRLKRRPRGGLAWHYGKKEGRDGYQAMERQEAITSFCYSPFIRHQLDFAASRISYRSTDNSSKLSANRVLLSYWAGLSDWLDVSFGAGGEDLEGGYGDTGLLRLAVEGKLGDKVNGRLEFSRDVVADTTASLSRNVVAEKFSGGVAFDLFPRLLAGGGCRYVKYSDDNELDGYDFWVSSIIFTEPTYLEFTYYYDFQDAAEREKPRFLLLDDGFAGGDHPYWTPGDYWYNRFRLYFKHMLSGDTMKRGSPTYYTVEYAIDYDGDGHMVQNVKGEFFLEITPHVILESRVGIVSSDEIRNREFFVSAVYRW